MKTNFGVRLTGRHYCEKLFLILQKNECFEVKLVVGFGQQVLTCCVKLVSIGIYRMAYCFYYIYRKKLNADRTSVAVAEI